jgi:CspA family cold shock protein
MITGRIACFDPNNGYGLIEPDDGSPQVLVHPDDFGGLREISVGTPVKFSCIQGNRGPKAYNIIIISQDDAPAELLAAKVLDPQAYAHEIAQVLISKVPDITTTQISDISKKLTKRAARRGWVRSAR